MKMPSRWKTFGRTPLGNDISYNAVSSFYAKFNQPPPSNFHLRNVQSSTGNSNHDDRISPRINRLKEDTRRGPRNRNKSRSSRPININRGLRTAASFAIDFSFGGELRKDCHCLGARTWGEKKTGGKQSLRDWSQMENPP
jgi:hypothetical protein